jgi:hypothetical protein
MTYVVAGVTVTSIKLEQSALRELTGGIFPVTVPVTALAQLSAMHAESTPCAKAKARMKDKSFIIATRESACEWMDLGLESNKIISVSRKAEILYAFAFCKAVTQS